MDITKIKPKKKRFNTAGNCYPHIHYMMDSSAKIEKAMELIDYGDYFTINRPRQYGKTTLLFSIEQALKNSEAYLPILLTFENIDKDLNVTEADLAKSFIIKFTFDLLKIYPHLQEKLEQISNQTNSMFELSYSITKIINLIDKKVILLIDEVDASSNYKPFLTFLAILRAKYLNRFSSNDYTFHSVILAGVHDVKSLKYKIKDSHNVQYNSPWNIAVNFIEPMEFNPKEIAPMLVEYNEAENIGMNEKEINEIAEKLYYYTSGYPFLVSRLCQIMANDILPKKTVQNQDKESNNNKKWNVEDVEQAVILIQKEVNTNFESLIKNLQNNPDLYTLVFDMLLNGKTMTYNPHNSVIEKGTIYGVFKQNGKVKIHNRIYEQIIYNYLVSNVENEIMQPYLTEHKFVLPNKELNFELILERFQVYIRESFGKREVSFLENQWRLIFLAFLRPIINGNGYEFKEVQISDERRIDVVITYYSHKYIIELKIWRGDSYHERGILQLYDYLEKQNKDIGYLVIFDDRKTNIDANEYKSEWIEIENKRIFAVWV